MNWREIDAVLGELNLEGCRLNRVRQPDYHRGDSRILRIGIPGSDRPGAQGANSPGFIGSAGKVAFRKPCPRPPRFAALIRSRLEGRRLTSLSQLGRDRIVRFAFAGPETSFFLDAKLWGNGANLILTEPGGLVIDAFSRRPNRGEAPGGKWPPEGIGMESAAEQETDDRFVLRNLPGVGDWNSRVEEYYADLESGSDLKRRLDLWRNYLDRRERALAIKAESLERDSRRFEAQNRDGHWADLIMSSLHEIAKGDSALEIEDWENPGERVRIPLDTTLSPGENAQRYYGRQKRAARALERLAEDREALVHTQARLDTLRFRLDEGDTGSAPFDADPPEVTKRGERKTGTLPGLWIRKDPYIIVVGRNARESDFLLRRWSRGNDTWLHARDWPGGHVFVRAPRGKSIPLEVLLDAGNLALSYSKGRSSGEADLYYTQVKNLRRPKDGNAGTVLPNREKNLRVRLELQRLEALKALAESG